MIRAALLACLGLALAPPAAAEDIARLQPMVDATPEGGALKLAPGVYAGPVVVTRSMTIDGAGAATLTGQGQGSVLTLRGRGIKIQGLTIADSGKRHENLDACVRLENASFNVLRDNKLDDCLVGIDLRQADDNVVRRNTIQGREPNLDIRGDGIRVWRSFGNRLENNVVLDHRDVLIEYSSRNVFAGNRVSNGRYGTHFMYASGNVARANTYAYNTVGLFSMYSNDLCLIDNRITHGDGPAGIGVGLKEASNVKVENNEILGNAIGVYLDDSPFDPDASNTFRGNRFAFNAIAVEFHANSPGNIFEGDTFHSNYTDVIARGGDGATASTWRGNAWDAYEGFDRKRPGVGDTPFESYAYADQLWTDVPATSFYRGAPVFEAIDFLARLAPFSKPRLVLSDPAPATRPLKPAPADCGEDHGVLAP